jgi:hypothetical protein
LSPPSGSGDAITGNPAKAGVFNVTIKATDGGLTATLAYEITITVQARRISCCATRPITAAS